MHLSIMLDQQEKFKNDHFTVDFVGEAQTDPTVFKRVMKYSYPIFLQKAY